MSKVKNNAIKLVNKYTKEEVYTRDYDNVIKVFNQSNPQRTYLVNRTAFVVAK